MQIGERRPASSARPGPVAAARAARCRRLTIGARSTRRTMVPRLERVVRERLHHAGARHAHDPALRPVAADVGDHARLGRGKPSEPRREPDADERRQIGARDLRRGVDRPVLLGQPRELDPCAQRVALLRSVAAFGSSASASVVRLSARLEIAARFEHLADLGQRAASDGSSSIALRKCSSAASRSLGLALERRQLAIEKRTVRRAGDGARRRPVRASSTVVRAPPVARRQSPARRRGTSGRRSAAADRSATDRARARPRTRRRFLVAFERHAAPGRVRPAPRRSRSAVRARDRNASARSSGPFARATVSRRSASAG